MVKILVVFGTRPEAIKMAPLIIKLKNASSFNVKVCITAQHRQLLDMVLDLFNIRPDHDLNLMSVSQTLTEITNRVIKGIQEILIVEKPDFVLVHGDTATTFASALAAFYEKIPVGHVEAGLRSGNIYSPYPEEMNRRLISTIATLHFAPTIGNKENLLSSGIDNKKIFVTGNTVIDALKMTVNKNYIFNSPLLNELDFNKKILLLTAHRRENWGSSMREIFFAVKTILKTNPDVELIFPVHPNPVIRDLSEKVFGSEERIYLVEPLEYEPFANLMAKTYFVLTDSGGIQEEAPALGKPVLVLRTETERPEAVEAGTVKVVGINKDSVIENIQLLLDDEEEYSRMAKATNPYGDGHASEKIVKVLEKWFS